MLQGILNSRAAVSALRASAGCVCWGRGPSFVGNREPWGTGALEIIPQHAQHIRIGHGDPDSAGQEFCIRCAHERARLDRWAIAYYTARKPESTAARSVSQV